MSDGEHTTPELDFAILLLSNHQQPPVFQVLDPLLEVSVGGQAVIGERRSHTDTRRRHQQQQHRKRTWMELCVSPVSHYV